MLFSVYNVPFPIYTSHGIKEGLEIILNFNKEIECQLKDIIVGFRIEAVFSYYTVYGTYDEELNLYDIENVIFIIRFKDRTDILRIHKSFTIHKFENNYILILDSK